MPERSGPRRRSPDGPGDRWPLGPRDPFAALLAAAAESRVDDAAAARARIHELRRQAGEEGTLAGILADLGERGATVVAETVDGRRHVGVVRAVGADFVALAVRTGATALVSQRWLTVVRTPPGTAPAVSGDRAVRLRQRLADVLVELAPDRPTLVIGLRGGELRGTLRAVGQDVATVWSGDAPGSPAYVTLEAITDVLVARGDTADTTASPISL